MEDIQVKTLFSKEEAAVYLEISVRTLDRKLKNEELIPVRNGKFVQFTHDSLQAYKSKTKTLNAQV